MEKEQLKKNDIPNTPGIYFFLGAKKEILYIGKATSLKSRIQSYFSNDLAEKRSVLIEKMIHEARSVEWTETDSVLEAIILETNLIRTHKPHFNTLAKDDKSYNHLIITNENFPRVLVVRGKDITEKFTEREIKYHFGPYPSSQLFRDALKIIQKLFKFYDTKKPVGSERSRLTRGQIDFNRQIGLYPSTTSKQEYNKTIRHIRLFFEGKKKQLIKELEKEMIECAKKENFEKAAEHKKKIFALTHIEDVSLIKNDLREYQDEKTIRIEAYDVAHHGGGDMVGVMTVLSGMQPLKSEYRKFKIKTLHKSNDPAALKEMLERRFMHSEWNFPRLIVVDGGVAQKNVAEAVIKKNNLVIPVVGVVKDEKHNPKKIIGVKKVINSFREAILLANSEAHRFSIAFHRKRSRKNALL